MCLSAMLSFPGKLCDFINASRGSKWLNESSTYSIEIVKVIGLEQCKLELCIFRVIREQGVIDDVDGKDLVVFSMLLCVIHPRGGLFAGAALVLLQPELPWIRVSISKAIADSLSGASQS